MTIQEGCDKFCVLCGSPQEAQSSRSVDELIKESKDLVKNGSREIILLGQNVNAYNYKGKKLSHLINEIASIDNLQRIRYSTSHPLDFTNDLIEVHGKQKKLMPLIHLPVQSGSNKILKKMNRRHTVEYYMSIINELKKINSRIEFSSDFIIGFPGETSRDFDHFSFIRKGKYINSYSFIFSPRPGTPAANMTKVEDKLLEKD